MASNVIVQMSGPTTAFLSYDVMNSPGDQEGFLLGEITTDVTDGVGDSQAHCETKGTLIRIDYHLPCVRPSSFYDGYGNVDSTVLENLLGDRKKHLIGWYRFRRNSTLESFLCETAIHKNLQSLVSKKTGQFFILALLTATTSDNMSTHTLDRRFFRFTDKMESLPSSVVALQSSSCSEYCRVELSSDAAAKLNESVALQTDGGSAASSSEVAMDNIYAAVHRELRASFEHMIANEEEIASLKAEIQNMKKQLNN